jgi:hypothetical protein
MQFPQIIALIGPGHDRWNVGALLGIDPEWQREKKFLARTGCRKAQQPAARATRALAYRLSATAYERMPCIDIAGDAVLQQKSWN